MDLTEQIIDILVKENRTVKLQEFEFLLHSYYPKIPISSISDITEITGENPHLFKVENENVTLVDGANLRESNLIKGAIIDSHLKKLSDLFILSGLQHPIHHFALFVLFDRVIHKHFENDAAIQDQLIVSDYYSIYYSQKPTKDYLAIIQTWSLRGLFIECFSGIENLFQKNSPQEADMIYKEAFSLCLSNGRRDFDRKLFGKRFNKFLSNLLNGNKDYAFSVSPELINRLIPRLVKVKTGQSVYDPAVGIGSFFVELAHEYNTFDFKAIGIEINWFAYQLCNVNLKINGLTNYKIYNEDAILGNHIEDFSVDISVCNPPFGNTKFYRYQAASYNPMPSENSLLFTLHLLQKTKRGGQIIEIVNDGALFSQNNQKYRRDIIEEGLLEKVISLPVGVFSPITNVNASVIILNKDLSRKGSIAFIEGREGLNIKIKNRQVAISEKELYTFFDNITQGFAYKKKAKPGNFIPMAIVAPSVVVENDYDFSPIRYTHTVLQQIERAKENGEKFVSLSEILDVAELPRKFDFKDSIPFLKITDLGNEGGSINISDIAKYTPSKSEISGASELGHSAIIVSRVAGALKPTIIRLGEKEKVILHSNLTAFKIKSNGIDENYLLGQLTTNLVKEQLQLYRSKGSGVVSISQNYFLKIQIPLPKISEQLAWVARNRVQRVEEGEQISFLRSLPLVESQEDLKIEIEKFAKRQFNSGIAEYKSVFDFEKFPFSKTEVEASIHVKKSKELDKTVLLLDDDNFGIFGALEIYDENPVDYVKSQTVRSYANFLFRTYNYLTRTSTNRQLERFAHTSKNFFAGVQGRLDAIISSENDELKTILKKTLVETEMEMEYFKRKGKSESEFTLFNHLYEIKNSISGIATFYLKTDSLFKSIQGAEKRSFDIVQIILEIKNIHPEINFLAPHSPILVLSKSPLVKQALLDLVQNSVKYSSDKVSTIEITMMDSFILISISNPVSNLILEERYNQLGKDWLKDESSQYIHYGLFQSFQAIKEADAEIELSDYNWYSENKVFKIMIKLQKALW